MKFFVVALSLFAVATAAPTYPDSAVEVHRRLSTLGHEEIHDEFGQFALRYVTAEGTVVSENGRLVPTSDGAGYVMVIEGQVSYIGDDGQTYVTKYTSQPAFPVSGIAEPITAPEPVVVAEPVEEIAEPFRHVVERFY